MGRLIDAGLVLDNLSGRLESMKDYDAVKDVINNMPTAYDPDKVVQQLEKLKSLVPVNRVLDDIINDKPKELGMLIAYEKAMMRAIRLCITARRKKRRKRRMSRVLSILFNTEMVRAILDGRKTCTRRLVKPQPKSKLCYTFAGSDSDTWGYPNRTAHEIWGEEFKLPNDITEEELSKRWNPPYHTDDILYVRETWKKAPNGYYYYKDWKRNDIADVTKWKPSIYMPKDAARIWLKVTDVRVERLQDMTDDDAEAEGCFDYTSTALGFFDVWDSTIKKSDLDRYGWNANPWV